MINFGKSGGSGSGGSGSGSDGGGSGSGWKLGASTSLIRTQDKNFASNKQIPKTAAFSPSFTQRKLTKLVYTKD